MKRILLLFVLLLLTLPTTAATFGVGQGGPSTTDNDDTCDIAVLPAATLLLPFFEVDTELPLAQSTVITITNVSNIEQVARVTLWTDYSYPVISFNLYLTGYDVVALNLFDIIERGIIAPDAGTGSDISPQGPLSEQNTGIVDRQFCDRMPGQIDDAYIQLMQGAFLEGVVPALGNVIPGCTTVGNVHELATGYATIDVVGNCRFSQPHEAAYFTTDIRYDNVLTGDYQQVNLTTQTMAVNPLVHIRAIPEGGTPASRQHGAQNKTNFERTFYDRYSPSTHSDARQPLPSTFHARWMEGGSLQYETAYKIWREGVTGTGAVCNNYPGNADLPVREVVVFDDRENPVAGTLTLPETSLLHVNDPEMPQHTNGATHGWTYFNLDTVVGDAKATQNWVIVSMGRANSFTGDFDATALGNGCSSEAGPSEASDGPVVIGPARRVRTRPIRTSAAPCTIEECSPSSSNASSRSTAPPPPS